MKDYLNDHRARLAAPGEESVFLVRQNNFYFPFTLDPVGSGLISCIPSGQGGLKHYERVINLKH